MQRSPRGLRIRKGAGTLHSTCGRPPDPEIKSSYPLLPNQPSYPTSRPIPPSEPTVLSNQPSYPSFPTTVLSNQPSYPSFPTTVLSNQPISPPFSLSHLSLIHSYFTFRHLIQSHAQAHEKAGRGGEPDVRVVGGGERAAGGSAREFARGAAAGPAEGDAGHFPGVHCEVREAGGGVRRPPLSCILECTCGCRAEV